MGFSIIKIRDKYNDASHKEWLIDTDEELEDIPLNQCPPGTEAYSVESGKRFILDNNHEWQDKPNDGSSGGGQDGFSPTIAVTDITDGHRFTITGVNGETTVDVMDGVDGNDGYSPLASVTKSGNTTTITITDENGTTTAQVSDGTNGTDGTTFTPAVSSAGVISWTNDGGKQNPASVDLAAPVIQAVKPTVTSVTGATPSIALADNTIFSAGTLTSLTVTGSLNEGQIAVIVFTSGSTATQLTMPSAIKMPDSFAVEANRTYEISIMGSRGAVQSWT